MPLKQQTKAISLETLGEGTVVTFPHQELIERKTFDKKTGEPRVAYIGKLADGRTVWIPNHIVERIDGNIEGTYEVYSFPTDYGNDGWGLRDAAPTQP